MGLSPCDDLSNGINWTFASPFHHFPASRENDDRMEEEGRSEKGGLHDGVMEWMSDCVRESG